MGQLQYANMLSTTLFTQVPPIAREFTTLQPLGASVKSKLLSPATIKPGKRIRLKVKVTTKGPKTGRVGVRAVNTKAVVRYKSVNLPKSGSRKISLPKKWSRVGGQGKVRVIVQFLGNISVKPSNKDKVKQFIGKRRK
ncbi:MAG: hypothetical protein R2720_09895 [Candidatus Nanopelagicales bacterium]